ncbi:hypothetical protein COLO4_34035 [Corchorus olitorius]|uniref:Uncharacterized protein n=1 Tax=Corchorus olitorius TaxID=93759 RepID=A0A1R3GP37_9ROSI|nr:hypothetical protein COLO4_34035 [Corchorus olitorius]
MEKCNEPTRLAPKKEVQHEITLLSEANPSVPSVDYCASS